MHKNEKGWINCPLYKRYKKEKKEYLKYLKNRILRKKQEKALWMFIADVFSELDEPNKQFWIQRLTTYYRNRLYYVPTVDWISFIGEFNDRQAWGKYQNPKCREYCLKIRDAALKRIDKQRILSIPESPIRA